MIVNARMYSVTPAAAHGWQRLLEEVMSRAGVAGEVFSYPAPARLEGLWQRSDLLAVFMCGWPFAQGQFAVKPVATPVTSEAAEAGLPGQYRTLFIVPARANVRRLEETFGTRLAYTNPESHSGYNAVRYHLSGYLHPGQTALYREQVGPLVTPRRVVEAVIGAEADIGPLDSYAWSLLCRHEAELMQQVKVIAHTRAAPMPLLVASEQADPGQVEAMRKAFLSLDPLQDADLLNPLALHGFIAPPADNWQVVRDWEELASARGYPHLR